MAEAGPVLHLADLAGWDPSWPSLAVLGYPVAHSLSPQLHHGALAAMAADAPDLRAWRYHRVEVRPADLAEALPRLHAAGFLGLNLTVPHKVLAATLVARIAPAAAAMGAVNTLRRLPAGGWEGRNTDGPGLARALDEDLGRTLAGSDVVLLGAGGAARGAAVQALADGCRSLWVGNRSADRLDELLALLRPRAGGAVIRGFDLAHPPPLPAGALVINATSSGLDPAAPPPLTPAALPAGAAVYDMVYNPPVTPLLAATRSRGLPAANGLSMLIHQAALALEWWTGLPVPASAMRAAVA